MRPAPRSRPGDPRGERDAGPAAPGARPGCRTERTAAEPALQSSARWASTAIVAGDRRSLPARPAPTRLRATARPGPRRARPPGSRRDRRRARRPRLAIGAGWMLLPDVRQVGDDDDHRGRTAAAAAYVRTDEARIGGYGSGADAGTPDRQCGRDGRAWPGAGRRRRRARGTSRAGGRDDRVRRARDGAGRCGDGGAVVGLGGDGTYNEVANGSAAGTLMGVLPAGASSVFARHLGFVTDARGRRPRAGRGDPGGVDPHDRPRRRRRARLHVRRRTRARRRGDGDRRPRPARAPGNERPGDLQVLATALRRPARGGVRPARADDADPGRRIARQRRSYVAVANQHPYTFLGRMPVRAAPRADFEHGLDVVFTRELRAPRPVAPAGVRPDLAAPRQPRQPPRRLPPRPAPTSRSSATSRPPSRSTASTWATSSGSSSRYGRDAIRVLVPPGRGSRRTRRLSFAGHGRRDRHQPGARAWRPQPGCSRPRRSPPRASGRHPGLARGPLGIADDGIAVVAVAWALVAIELVADAVWPGAQAGAAAGPAGRRRRTRVRAGRRR